MLTNGTSVPTLHLVIARGDNSTAARLIDNRADVNEQTSYGATPLFIAGNTDTNLDNLSRILSVDKYEISVCKECLFVCLFVAKDKVKLVYWFCSVERQFENRWKVTRALGWCE